MSLVEVSYVLGSAVAGVFDNIVDAALSASVHSNSTVRVASASTLRALAAVLPSRASQLATKCVERVHQFRNSPYALHGSCIALAAVVGGR